MSEMVNAIVDAVDARLLELHTGIPGVVKSYDLATGTAAIDIIVPIDGEKIATLQAVRVGWYQTNTAFMSLPIKPGDFVYVMVAEQSLDKYRAARGAFQYSEERARHHFHNAWAQPCCPHPDNIVAPAHADNIVLGFHEGPTVSIQPDGTVAVDGDLEVDGDITATGEIKAKFGTPGVVGLSTHTHATGVGPSGPPTPGT